MAGVIENMGAMVMPDGSTMDVFGSGGGQIVADRLGVILGHEVPLLASVPLDPTLRSGGDAGTPIVLDSPESPAAQQIQAVADKLAIRSDSLVGKNLNLGVN